MFLLAVTSYKIKELARAIDSKSVITKLDEIAQYVIFFASAINF